MLYLTADLHLVPRVWKHRAVLAGDAFRAWYLMVDAIIEDGAEEKTLILAGDTLDFRMIEGATTKALEEGIGRLFEAGIGVAFVDGNHDGQAVNHLEALGCIPLGGKSMDIQGLKVFGLDYLPREDLLKAFETVPDCDLLVMHGAGQHLLGFEGAYDYTLDELPEQAANILVGDIHTTDVTTTAVKTRVISPGSLHPCNITEGGEHGFFKMDPKTQDLEFVTVRTRQIHRLSAWDEEEFETGVKAFLSDLPEVEPEYRPIVEVTYNVALSGLVLGTSKAFEDKAVFFHDERIELDDVVMSERPVYKQTGMLDALESLPKRKGEEDAMAMLRGLLSTPDPEAYLNDKTEEVLSDS